MVKIPNNLRSEVEKWRNLERERAENAAWSYPDPWDGYDSIHGYWAFYAAKMEGCTIDGERVKPQPGEFYGGWITDDIVGPFKGEPGTEAW